ncbi:MAG: hypothetical protein LBQ35_00085 [Spirochaetaceae bacterium]|nr:hypothetical protein [Spirochaetaceae bacterium]
MPGRRRGLVGKGEGGLYRPGGELDALARRRIHPALKCFGKGVRRLSGGPAGVLRSRPLPAWGRREALRGAGGVAAENRKAVFSLGVCAERKLQGESTGRCGVSPLWG